MHNNIFKTACVFLVGLSGLFLSPSTYSKEYTVGVENIDYYPQYGVDAKGQYVGYARAILDAFAEKSGHTFVYLPFPIERLFSTYLNSSGGLDLKYPDNPLWAQADKKGIVIKYSQPVVRYIDGVLLPKNLKGKGLNSLTSFSMIRGFTPLGYEAQISKNQLAISENVTTEAALKMALNSRVQGVYGNVSVYSYLLDKANSKDVLSYDPTLPHDEDNYYLSSYKYPELIEEFNKFLEKEKVMVAQLKVKFKVEEGL